VLTSISSEMEELSSAATTTISLAVGSLLQDTMKINRNKQSREVFILVSI